MLICIQAKVTFVTHQRNADNLMKDPLSRETDNSVNGFNYQSTNTVTSAASSPETGNKTKPTTTTTNLNVCKVVSTQQEEICNLRTLSSLLAHLQIPTHSKVMRIVIQSRQPQVKMSFPKQAQQA